MLKLSIPFLYNSRVFSRTSIASIYTKLNEFSMTTFLETNHPKSDIALQNIEPPSKNLKSEKQSEVFKTKSRIVAAAFASLNDQPVSTPAEISTPHTDQKIASAETVEQLLQISNGEGVSRRLALKVVSVLADWTATKKIKLADFENDFRFIKLCKVLTRGGAKYERHIPSKSEDLSTVLSVTADDEAAKLVETITLPQMVKVMKTLSNKKRRSTLLLRTLAYNISGSPDKLDLKLCSDLLYSISTLNFIDENLLSRIALDICMELESETEVKKSAVIGSIIMSLGILRYKNPVLLDLLTDWIAKRYETCRSQDVFSLFVTLAILNHMPADAERCFKPITPILTEVEAGKPINWLDHIWSKTLLNISTPDEISNILSENFLTSLIKSGSEQTISTKLKLLNLKGFAECLIEGYQGIGLTNFSELIKVTIPKRKEKIEMVESIVNSLKNLIQNDKYLRTNVDTGYGFVIDAECIFDDKFTPKELSLNSAEGVKIAIMALDYHDMTRGRIEPTGMNIFAKRLLEARGYKVLMIPFSEFKPKDKLISRVQYLEKSLKELVKSV